MAKDRTDRGQDADWRAVFQGANAPAAVTLARAGNPAQPTPDAIRARGPDTTWQYRFAHPGKGHRAAIIGAYGSSLYVDFDHGTVVAVFASHAQRHSPLLMASLRSLWDAAIRTKE